MTNKYLILVDEQAQRDTLGRLKTTLRDDGFNLIYTEINPTDYTKRNSGEISFDKEKFEKHINDIEYFRQTDIILCDYNLIKDVINGYEIIRIIRNLKYNKNKKIILYSAKIDDIIHDIITRDNDFDVTKENLKNLINSNIEFIRRDSYDSEVIKIIRKEPEFDFENELTNWFYKRKDDTFCYLFPKYEGKSLGYIAEEIQQNSNESIAFKKELIEQIVAYLTIINDLE